MSARAFAAVALAAGIALAGCGEKPQSLGARKIDTQAWDGAKNPYVAPGWKVGDEASWEEQLRRRTTSGQNEYTRTTGAS